MEDVGEQGKDGLSAVELEEGADSAEGYGCGCFGGGVIGVSG